MGLLDKLFGGDKQPEPGTNRPDPAAPASSPTTPTPPPAAPEGAAAPARRERVKRPEPSQALPPSEFDPAPQAAAPQPIEVDENAENATLLHAINAIVAADNADTRNGLYSAILGSTFYLVSMPDPDAEPAAADTTGEELVLSEGQQIHLATIQSPQGQTFLPAFTDLDRLRKTLPQNAKYVRMAAPNLCRLFGQGPGEGIVINPGSAPSGVITRGEAEILAMGAIPQVGPDGQLQGPTQQQVRITIGKPKAQPAASFVEAIQKAAQAQPSVREVHLFSAGVEDQPMRLMIGLLVDTDQTPEQMQPTFETIGRAAYEARGETEPFDMMPLQDEMIESIRPLEGLVYVRSVIV